MKINIIAAFVALFLSISALAADKVFYDDLVVVNRPNAINSDESFLIVTPQLNQEFARTYLETFGQFYERTYYHRVQNNMLSDRENSNLSSDGERTKVKSFGEYVIKRTTEYHGERLLQKEPALRPILKVKNKVENIDVKVAPDFLLKIHYSLVGNYLNLNILNPYFDSKLVFLMDDKAFGPTPIHSSTLYAGVGLGRKTYLEGSGEFETKGLGVRINHRLKKNVSGYFSNKNFAGTADLKVQENLKEIGLKWDY